MSQVILISGKMGSGKTTLQNELALRLMSKGFGEVYKVNFADILYEMHDAVLKILHRYWPRRDIVKDGPLLQMLGTEWGRQTIDKDIWVKTLQARMDLLEGWCPTYFIIGDCRFENEFNAFPNALKIRLECPKEIRKRRCSMWRDRDDHPSEIGLDEYRNQGLFDIQINTDTVDTINAAETIVNYLSQKKRDQHASR